VQRYGEGGSIDLFIDYIKPGPRTSMALRALFRWNSQAQLPLVTVPTLVLCSESDAFVKNIGHVAELLPNAELKIVAGGEPHPLYNQEIFTNEVAAFCRA
jgi:pimeloyl-ACP methyl ester carboxylesterase